MLRWRGRINVWESLYILPASLSVNIRNSLQFIGLAASVEKPQLATAVGMFYLSQQIGFMIGASRSAALLRKAFQDALLESLSDCVNADKVRSFHVCIALRFNEPVLRAGLPAFADDNKPYSQIIKGILNDSPFAFHLPAKVRAIALLSRHGCEELVYQPYNKATEQFSNRQLCLDVRAGDGNDQLCCEYVGR